MKIALIVVAALVAFVAVMAIIGAMLPQNHVATRSARFRRPPADVFAAISSPAAFKGFEDLDLSIVENVAPTRLVTRIGPGKPFGGTWTYELAAEGDGTVLTITEHGEVYNPVFRFLSRYAFGHTGTMDRYLKDLDTKL